MSRGFVKEGDQEEIPMVLPRAFLPKGTPNYVTKEGLDLLCEEMESLKKEWSDAGSNYVTKNFLDAKMRLLSERINTAILIDIKKSDPDVVSFGSFVKYNDKVIRIVGVDEADASKGLVSFISPIAKALIGKKKGDKFEIRVPKGTEIIEIKDVTLTEMHNLTNVKAKTKIHVSEQTMTEDIGDPIANTVIDNIQYDNNQKEHQHPIVKVQSSEIFIPENNPTDFLPLINNQGNIIGRALLCEIHNGNKVLHPAVHLWVYNSKNEIVGKYWWHVAFGENAEKTLKRKIKDITSENIKPKFKKEYIRENKNEKELVSVYTSTIDGIISKSPNDKDYEMIFEKDGII